MSSVQVRFPIVQCAVAILLLAAQGALASNRGSIVRSAAVPSPAKVAASDLELFEEIGAALGNISTVDIAQDVSDIKDMLLPVFAASPKNKFGKLDDVAARYALHRVFMERHGWQIKAFDEVDESRNASTPYVFNLGRWMPAAVQGALEKHIGSYGSGIQELSIVAAVLEHVIREEMPRKLQVVYQAEAVPVDSVLNKAQAEIIIDLYMASYLVSEPLDLLAPNQVFELQTAMHSVYNHWEETQQFFRSIQDSVAPDLKEFTFSDVAYVIAHIEKNYVYWLGQQCFDLKSILMELEYKGSGKVRLLDFYNYALQKGMWQFSESAEYLRQLGALDESDPLDPRIVISTYIQGPGNCVARTSYYSMCCMDECADLYGHLESELGKPDPTPIELISVVRALASPTMQKGRLSVAILRRLYDIADHHDGRVPLHGHFFAEWMHFAYPRECPLPSLFGPAHWKTVEEWTFETQDQPIFTFEEMATFVDHLTELEGKRHSNVTASLSWTWDEAACNATDMMSEAEDAQEFKDLERMIEEQTVKEMGRTREKQLHVLLAFLAFTVLATKLYRKHGVSKHGLQLLSSSGGEYALPRM